MLSIIHDPLNVYQRRFNRREALGVGGLSLLGLTAPQLARLRSTQAEDRTSASDGSSAKHRYNSFVFIFLFGGPSQIDLWDMKPAAPVEIRGDFKPISTKVPGIQICEHLPGLASQMDKVCLVRSMTHNMNVHGPACSEIFSGREYFNAPTTDQADPQDWPSLSSMMMRFGKPRGGMPPSIVLPWYLQFTGQSRRIAGQTGGRMGERHNALLMQGSAATLDFQVDGLKLEQTVPIARIQHRRELFKTIQAIGRERSPFGPVAVEFEMYRQRAFSLLQGRAGELFDIQRETPKMRDRYGRTMVGQSLLMARRLVEAGVSLVSVNWEDETKISGTNTCWDTHENNFSKLNNLLCPIFDQAYPAFLQDLDERGLLETTLVVAVGEFGRTPHMGQFSQSNNTKKSGRDHWPSVFTALIAGGGVRGGQVYGESDRHAGFVKDNPVSPADLTATIFHHLGVDPSREYVDEFQKLRHQVSDGRPLNLG